MEIVSHGGDDGRIHFKSKIFDHPLTCEPHSQDIDNSHSDSRAPTYIQIASCTMLPMENTNFMLAPAKHESNDIKPERNFNPSKLLLDENNHIGDANVKQDPAQKQFTTNDAIAKSVRTKSSSDLQGACNPSDGEILINNGGNQGELEKGNSVSRISLPFAIKVPEVAAMEAPACTDLNNGSHYQNDYSVELPQGGCIDITSSGGANTPHDAKEAVAPIERRQQDGEDGPYSSIKHTAYGTMEENNADHSQGQLSENKSNLEAHKSDSKNIDQIPCVDETEQVQPASVSLQPIENAHSAAHEISDKHVQSLGIDGPNVPIFNLEVCDIPSESSNRELKLLDEQVNDEPSEISSKSSSNFDINPKKSSNAEMESITRQLELLGMSNDVAAPRRMFRAKSRSMVKSVTLFDAPDTPPILSTTSSSVLSESEKSVEMNYNLPSLKNDAMDSPVRPRSGSLMLPNQKTERIPMRTRSRSLLGSSESSGPSKLPITNLEYLRTIAQSQAKVEEDPREIQKSTREDTEPSNTDAPRRPSIMISSNSRETHQLIQEDRFCDPDEDIDVFDSNPDTKPTSVLSKVARSRNNLTSYTPSKDRATESDPLASARNLFFGGSGYPNPEPQDHSQKDNGAGADYLQYLLTKKFSSTNFITRFESKDVVWSNNAPTAKFVGPFLLGTVIGKGSYGKVKDGVCSETLQAVAIKIVAHKRLKKITNGIESVNKEIQTLRRLRGHVNVVRLLDVYAKTEDEDGLVDIVPWSQQTELDTCFQIHKRYLVFEYCHGNLQSLLDSTPGSTLPLHQVQEYH
jgi:hypothetical protein